MKLGQQFEVSAASCSIHGEYTSFLNRGRWTGCETCAQKAIADSREEQFREARRSAVQAKLKQAGIPEIYRSATLDGETEQWMQRTLSDGTRGPLVLVGSVGTGKSYQSCAALIRWIKRTERGGHYLPAAEFAVQMRSTWGNRSAESERDVLGRYAKSPFLVLDDIGAGRDNDMQIVQGLIDTRYSNGLMPKTIVVSNVAAANFASVFGERAADRIREGCKLIEMVGESRRVPES